ncbi:hypothetical protein [Solihabitans fulvus]|uniref:hypothetical protein n=1 Tax=Solihabitans fulvus TaxID=1892852 RepID=UPI001CB75F45|nr:hypothetical protein [Solihabitans fulvus]
MSAGESNSAEVTEQASAGVESVATPATQAVSGDASSSNTNDTKASAGAGSDTDIDTDVEGAGSDTAVSEQQRTASTELADTEQTDSEQADSAPRESAPQREWEDRRPPREQRAPSPHQRPRADDRYNERDRDEAPRVRAPRLPEGADISVLDPAVRGELRSLPKGLADIVGQHLAAAGLLVDEDPEFALEHARYARLKAARVGAVREAAGLTAYLAGEWAEALSELRAARRMTHGAGHLAIMADCERALGRPERALELAREARSEKLDAAEAVELLIVSAGARRDMGQLDAAVVALQGPDLDPKRRQPWSARLFYAYADNLAAAGRTDEAVRWFLNAAEADDDGETDAAERAFDLADETGAGAPRVAEAPQRDAAAEPEADKK